MFSDSTFQYNATESSDPQPNIQPELSHKQDQQFAQERASDMKYGPSQIPISTSLDPPTLLPSNNDSIPTSIPSSVPLLPALHLP